MWHSILFATKCWGYCSQVHKRSAVAILHRCWGVRYFWVYSLVNIFFQAHALAFNFCLFEALNYPMVFAVFYCEHSQCLTNTHDQCEHGKFDLNLSDRYFKIIQPSVISKLTWQVLCDRHFGGINYPVGGVGGIAVSL